MSFKHPEFLYLLLAVIIPIIIHLFNFRRYKKLWFSNITFLKNITTQTRKQNKIKHLLVLLARILAIVFIVLAFAGPEIGEVKTLTDKGQTVTAIYLDNSFSMMAEGEKGRLFDESVEIAREVVNQAPRDRQFILLNNTVSQSNRLLSREGIQSELDAQLISPSVREISAVLNSANRIVDDKEIPDLEFYLLSDFQQNNFDVSAFPADSVSEYFFVPFSPAQNRNIFIDSSWISQPVLLPGKQVTLNVRVRNASSADYDKIPLKLSINGQQKAVAAVDIPALSFEDVSITITPDQSGWQMGLVEIEDFPITFDDSYYFTFLVSKRIKVLEIFNEESSMALTQFYKSDTSFDFNSSHFRQVNFNNLRDYRLIIINSLPSLSSGLINQLKEYTKNGGTVLFIPDIELDFTDENIFLNSFEAGKITKADTSQSRVVNVKTNNELFKDVITNIPDNADLPVVFGSVNYSYNISTGIENLVSLLNGNDFLLTKSYGNGRLFLLSVPLVQEYSNFVTHPLFVPVMYGIATQQDIIKNLAFTIDEDKIIETEFSASTLAESPFVIQQDQTNYSFIPEQKLVLGNLVLDVHDGISQSGFYQLVLNDSVYQVFGFNYNREESSMLFYKGDDLSQLLADSPIKNYQVLENSPKGYTDMIGSIQKESDLWKLFLIFALLLLLVEIAILRFWK